MTEPATTDVLTILRQWRAEGHAVALATVVKTWGSAPRQPGSMLGIRDDGLFAGSVSGGCVEAAVIAEAQDVLKTGRPKRLSYGVSNETAWSVGLACGGQIDCWLERVD